jgi:capsular polysaccharide biosynthesis protein/Mrp family chromosome partitioning ATPase
VEDETRGEQQHIIADSVRRHVVFVLVIAIAFTCAAAAFTLTKHAKYTSTAKVLVVSLSGNPFSSDVLASGQTVTVAMTTEAGLVTSPDVVAAVASRMDRLGLPLPGAVSATVPPNSEIVQIRVRASSPAVARAGAEAYASAYLAYRAAQSAQARAHTLTSLEQQAQAAETELEKWSTDAASNSPSPDAATQVTLWASQAAAIATSISDLKAASTNPGHVVTPAELPTSPDGLNPILLIVATALLGLAAGVVLAIWRERRDVRIRTAYDDVVAEIPVLATLPGRRRVSPRQIEELAAEDALRVCYRKARAAVIAGAQAPSILVVSSVERGSADVDPAGEVAANLGWSLTSAGFSVTVVDASIGHGHVAELLAVDTAPGLSELLVARTASKPPTQQSMGMVVLPAGHNPEASREFYAGARLANSLSWFVGQSDYVIMAGPPVGTPDGEAVALVGDALLLVVVDKETTHQQVASVAAMASQLSIRILGAVGLQRRVGDAAWAERPKPKPPKRGGAVAAASSAPPSLSRATHMAASSAPSDVADPAPADSPRGSDGR